MLEKYAVEKKKRVLLPPLKVVQICSTYYVYNVDTVKLMLYRKVLMVCGEHKARPPVSLGAARSGTSGHSG